MAYSYNRLWKLNDIVEISENEQVTQIRYMALIMIKWLS